MRSLRLAPMLLVPALLLVAVPAAEAKHRATASLATKAGKTRLTVKLASTKRYTRASTPRSVKASAGKATYALSRTKRTGKSQTWVSKALTGKAAAGLAAAGGKQIRITVRTRRGKRTHKPVLKAPGTGGGGGGGGGATGLFARPAQPLTGNAAFNHIARYFVNSRITDCPGGWPNCAVEQRYNHCSGGGTSGGWEYRRLTPTSGSDINSVGQYAIAGAEVKADGSWVVEYVSEAYSSQSFYHWEVAQDGSATGAYWGPGIDPRTTGPSERYTGFRWQQPANCGNPY